MEWATTIPRPLPPPKNWNFYQTTYSQHFELLFNTHWWSIFHLICKDPTGAWLHRLDEASFPGELNLGEAWFFFKLIGQQLACNDLIARVLCLCFPLVFISLIHLVTTSWGLSRLSPPNNQSCCHPVEIGKHSFKKNFHYESSSLSFVYHAETILQVIL